ncbi:hypothetical protein JXA40_03605 [bacterium]|nr:hypothetical protein [candidate division CSSED10-310 bacterium]
MLFKGSGTWRRISRYKWFLLGFCLLFKFSHIQRYHGWDEAFYLSQMTSAVIDHDLVLQNDLLKHPNLMREKFRAVAIVMPSGAVQNGFAVGFAAVHSAYCSHVLLKDPSHPFGSRLQLVIALGAMCLLVFTFLLIRRILREYAYSITVANLSAGLAIAGGPLALYGTRSFYNTHILSAFWMSALILSFLLWRKSGRILWAVTGGLCTGMLGITRWQDIILVGVLLPALGTHLTRNRIPACRFAIQASTAAAVFAAIVLIQLTAWHIQFGKWLLIPQGSGYVQWSRPNVIPFLFSGYHGLIPWAPATALGFIGLFKTRRDSGDIVLKRLTDGLLLIVPVVIYICCCPDWWGGASYGPRRLSSLAPAAALGLAGILGSLKPAARMLLTAAVVGWALFTLSAIYFQLDDLTMLLTGRPDPFNEEVENISVQDPWKDPWRYWRIGFHNLVHEQFAEVDRPHGFERWTGAGMVLAVLAGCTLFFRCLRRSRILQRWIVVLICLWLSGVLAWLVFVIPSNDEWNGEWLSVIKGAIPDPSRREYPPGYTDAARFILSVRSAYLGNTVEAVDLFAGIDRPELYDMDVESILQFVETDTHRDLIRMWL